MSSGAVYIQSCYRTIKKSRSIPDSLSIRLEDSCFVECETHERSGGAVYISNEAADVVIAGCGFYRCRAFNSSTFLFRANAGGGGVAILANSITSRCTSFIACNTTVRRALGAYFQSFGVTEISNMLFAFSENRDPAGCVYIADRAHFSANLINCSMNKLADGGGGAVGASPMCQTIHFGFMNILNTTERRTMYTQHENNSQEIAFSNFIGNDSDDDIIFINQGTPRVEACVFISNRGSIATIAHRPLLIDCISDDLTHINATYMQVPPSLVITTELFCQVRSAAFTTTEALHLDLRVAFLLFFYA